MKPQVSYSYSRLCFRAEAIEPLAPTDAFCVSTPVGKFVMTKAEFYDVFSNVVASSSYSRRGLYHYPKPPSKADRFRTAT